MAMKNVTDISGKKYGFLTAIECVGVSVKAGHAMWRFECECGSDVVAYATNVKSGKTQSCGCHRVQFRFHHGGSYDPTYAVYSAMKQRCHNPKCKAFRFYGAKGVTVCQRWAAGYEFFIADMGPRPEGLTLDRIDPFGNYDPENCRWATWETQRKNKRKNYERLNAGV